MVHRPARGDGKSPPMTRREEAVGCRPPLTCRRDTEPFTPPPRNLDHPATRTPLKRPARRGRSTCLDTENLRSYRLDVLFTGDDMVEQVIVEELPKMLLVPVEPLGVRPTFFSEAKLVASA